jgi:hypothetical protein
MNSMHILSAGACLSFLLATGAFAEILGVQPRALNNPADNLPKEIQQITPERGTFGPSDRPGQRDDALMRMGEERPKPVTQFRFERNAEKTQKGGPALVAENVKEKSKDTSKKSMKNKHRGTTGSSKAGNDRPKDDPSIFQQQSSDESVQGQQLINEQPMKKQQPANRPASERGGSSK